MGSLVYVADDGACLPRVAIPAMFCMDEDINGELVKADVRAFVANHLRHLLPAIVQQRSDLTEVMACIRVDEIREAGGGIAHRRNWQTLKGSGFPIVALIHMRHEACAAIGTNNHADDRYAARTLQRDFAKIDLPLPPVYYAHLTKADPVSGKLQTINFHTQPLDVGRLLS